MLKLIRHGVALILVVWLLTPGLSGSAQTNAPAFNNDNVRNLITLDKMRGHLLASISDWDAARYDMAAQQSADIANELYSIVANTLKQANLQDQFLTAANAYAMLSTQAGDSATVHAAYDKLTGVIGDAAKAFAPAAAFDDPAFRLSVAQGLLTGVDTEYNEGVVQGKLASAVGYQSAVGFYQIAKEQYAAAQKSLQAAHPDVDKAVSAQYAALDKMLRADFTKEPAQPADPQDLETAITAIKTIVSSGLGLDLEAHRSVPEVLAAARTGLLDALDHYSNGKTDDAYEAASSAYLDNYEGLEVALRKQDSALTDTLEQQFLSFGKLIKDGKPIDDLKALYGQIDSNLTKAQDLLSAAS